MKEYFKVTDLKQVIDHTSAFREADKETISINTAFGRILGEDIISDTDLPDFTRSTMDGFAVCASSTFGASAGSPALLMITGSVAMGEKPGFSIRPGEAARIATGGMLPSGTDSVVMIEFTEAIDDTVIEVFKSVAPGQNIIEKGEDFQKGKTVLSEGIVIRPAEQGLLAAFGVSRVTVYKKPVIGIISTGDEIVPITENPPPGHIRDINSYSVAAMVADAGGLPKIFGIVKDDYEALKQVCEQALETSDVVLISGGSSVGTRDFTLDVLSSFDNSSILVHGISISPGKPTILANVCGKQVWGLPGHVVSAMVVFEIVVKAFILKMSGLKKFNSNLFRQDAVLTRNVPSAQGREDYIRVKLIEKDSIVYAEPVLGKSGMINTMVYADGLIRIPLNTEGLDKGSRVKVRLI